MILAFLVGFQSDVESIEKYYLISTQFEGHFLLMPSTKMKYNYVIFVRSTSKIRNFTMFVIRQQEHFDSAQKHGNRLPPYKISQPQSSVLSQNGKLYTLLAN
jgi:hypothetical protein